jgi:hypothetical protein
MAKVLPQDPKSQALARDGALNPHPEAVRDAVFTGNPFFDPKDLLQVRYEMVRRHQADGVPISDVAAAFGVSRPTFYKTQTTLAATGLGGALVHGSGVGCGFPFPGGLTLRRSGGGRSPGVPRPACD